ncbi:MAG: hypothetical protein QXF52_10660 [Thermoproteota archaeon]
MPPRAYINSPDYGDPRKYNSLLTGKVVSNAENHGGMVEIKAGNATLLLGDGVGLQYYAEMLHKSTYLKAASLRLR